MNDAPIACSLEQADLTTRRRRWHALAEIAPVEIAQTERGLRLRFRGGGADAEHELHELAVRERECCAFADWTVTAKGGDAFLDVTGESDEAVAGVLGMFSTLGASN